MSIRYTGDTGLKHLLSLIKSAIAAKADKSTATVSVDGLMSADDKTKLDGISIGANAYSLPTATSKVLGGVKTGSNITNSSGTISLTKENVTTALGYTPPTTNTTYDIATASANGLMSASDKSILDKLNNVRIVTLAKDEWCINGNTNTDIEYDIPLSEARSDSVPTWGLYGRPTDTQVEAFGYLNFLETYDGGITIGYHCDVWSDDAEAILDILESTDLQIVIKGL